MTAPSLLDHLLAQGYQMDLQASRQASRVAKLDLVVSGIGTVRVSAYPSGNRQVSLYDAGMGRLWTARFTGGTPDAVIIAAAEAAEWELAHKRGGPVTPAQEEAAR
jgi:hypothetical protein